MDEVEHAYQTLRELGLVKSQYDFSERWLGQCQSYYSATKSRGREPSVRSMLFLDHRLQSMRSAFAANIYNSAFAQRGAKRLGEVSESVSIRLRYRVVL